MDTEKHDPCADRITTSLGCYVAETLGHPLFCGRNWRVAGFVSGAEQRAAHGSFGRARYSCHQNSRSDQRERTSGCESRRKRQDRLPESEFIQKYSRRKGLEQKAEQIYARIKERKHTQQTATPAPGLCRVNLEDVVQQRSA